MPKRTDIKSILIIGSGPIVIGQACEFDYSGTQAVKALKEEGYRVILVNSNPATIMTDPDFADATYIEPITCEFVTKIIERERPDALLPTIGGQTALNVTLELAEAGVINKFAVQLIGASVDAIKKAEDRERFKEAVSHCGLDSAKSLICRTVEEGIAAAKSIGYPLIIRPSRTLGGSGGAIVDNEGEYLDKLKWGFDQSPIHELLIEESLMGWKEIELEVMRDWSGNGVIICGIENLDPMGLHTGDSVTVAPIQTLTDKEYQILRDSALKLMNEIGVDTGGCNVQFAICPKTGRQIVIEVNPRVSRSSALASKATGFPIAKIAAKLAVGYTLDELPNDITKKTPACFEPSIDYVVVKIPRFTFEKFPGSDRTLGTQMKSVGEVMAIGSTFAEALQKACRSLETDRDGLLGGPEAKFSEMPVLKKDISTLNPVRMYQIARCLELGMPISEIYEQTGYDPWFLGEIRKIVEIENELRLHNLATIPDGLLRRAKQLGTSDRRLCILLGCSEDQVYKHRIGKRVRPAFKKVDTCAAEFTSDTPYLYSTYQDSSDDVPSDRKKIVIIGGGPNRIGQGIEFDYCCVHAAFSLRDAGFETIMINCNPETVSTDYDTSDRLYFEPLTLEDVMEIVEREKPTGVIVQYGGQTPLKLSQSLQARGVPIIGTSPDSIDLTEDREKFRAVLEELGLRQAESGVARNEHEALAVAQRIGYPVMARPSFVLGGRAMAVINNDNEMKHYIEESVSVSFDRPVLIDRFLDNAIEVDVDAVCDGKKAVVAGIIEHVENAGIHSGDSTFMLPTETLSAEVLEEIEKATTFLAFACGVVGLMNVQYALMDGNVYVLEVNPRASRSVPFVSKVTGIPWAKVAARVMAGETLDMLNQGGLYGNILKHEHYQNAIGAVPFKAVKEVVFPFHKFRGVDAKLGPEMKSTGEVMALDITTACCFWRSQTAVGQQLPISGVAFLSVKDQDKEATLVFAKQLHDMGFSIIATRGTAAYLNERGVVAVPINKISQGSPNVVDKLKDGTINLVINTPQGSGSQLDSRPIRVTATEMGLPLFTTVAAAKAAVNAIEHVKKGVNLKVRPLQEYLATIETN
uniref:Carbamoyl-phosphate synthase large chain n=1 Tax=wastewater metagenome TaxID=527639 RepID=A0A0A8KXS0_9ZZZZ